MQANILEEQKTQTYAASLEERFLGLKIGHLETYIAGSISVTKQTDHCISSKTEEGIYH